MKQAIRELWLIPIGALYLVACTSLALWLPDARSGLGQAGDEIASLVTREYSGEIRSTVLSVLFVAAAIGLALGLGAWLLHRLRTLLRADLPFLSTSLLSGSVLIVVLHAFFFSLAVIRSPQLYSWLLYDQGGLRGLYQVALTDWFGAPGTCAVFAGALLCWFLSPSEWARAAKTLPRIRGRRGGIVASVVLALGGLLGEAGAQPSPSGSAVHPGASAVPNPESLRLRSGNDVVEVPSEQPDVVFLAIDSFRADHLTPDITPNLSKLRERSTLFTAAYVSLARTFPSWTTLLSGQYPHEHGVRTMFPSKEVLRRELRPLPKRLREAGYATGVVSDYAGDIFKKRDFGYEIVNTPSFDFRQLVRQRIMERAVPLLPFLHSQWGRAIFPVLRELNQAADPVMLSDDAIRTLRALRSQPDRRDGVRQLNDLDQTVHKKAAHLTVFYSTAHFPYAAPAPFYQTYASRSYRGPYKYHRPVDLEGAPSLGAEDIAQVRALYKGSLRAIDAAMAPLLKEILSTKRRTIVFVFADHGETLYEGGHGLGHGDHLFGDESLHIPMMMFDSAHPSASTVGQIVHDVDLLPTVASLVGMDGGGTSGHSMLSPSLRQGSGPAYAETGLWFTREIAALSNPPLRVPYPGVERTTRVDSETDDVVLREEFESTVLFAKHRAVIDTRYKYVHVPSRQGPVEFLFDRAHDRFETHNVLSAHPEEAKRLRALLRSWVLRDAQMTEADGSYLPSN